jgi:hypothetical protein
MRRYFFIVEEPNFTHHDSGGLVLLSHDAAIAYALRLIRELKDGGYDPAGAVLHVQVGDGETIISFPF